MLFLLHHFIAVILFLYFPYFCNIDVRDLNTNEDEWWRQSDVFICRPPTVAVCQGAQHRTSKLPRWQPQPVLKWRSTRLLSRPWLAPVMGPVLVAPAAAVAAAAVEPLNEAAGRESRRKAFESTSPPLPRPRRGAQPPSSTRRLLRVHKAAWVEATLRSDPVWATLCLPAFRLTAVSPKNNQVFRSRERFRAVIL